MASVSVILRNAKRAYAELTTIAEDPKSYLVVHYSCETFYDQNAGRSPRVTSIAVRHFSSGQTRSFSVHLAAERKGLDAQALDKEQLNDLERESLEDFYAYVDGQCKHMKLIHWNMRDTNYGFPALKHRTMVLGGKPPDIEDSRLIDMSRMLIDIYGAGYSSHPRLTSLIKMNDISDLDYLTGEEEARAFERGEYARLHQSTLRKVDIIANIIGRAANRELNVEKRRALSVLAVASFVASAKEHWAFSGFTVLFAVAGWVAAVWEGFHFTVEGWVGFFWKLFHR